MLSKEKLIEYSNKYNARWKGNPDETTEMELKDWFKHNRYLTKEKFLSLGLWKSKRPKRHYENNSEELIKEVTRLSLETECEEARIKLLTILKGVSWPVASVILHFAFPEKYPIMDFRAIWSLGWEQPKSYTFNFWQKYCTEIRKISDETGLTIRQIDKALWQYSKNNQK